MASAVPIADGIADLERARALAGDDALTAAHIRTAAACTRTVRPPSRQRWTRSRRPRPLHDRVLENVALDGLTSALLVDGDIRGALAAASRRIELLAAVPLTARTGLEFADGFSMVGECAMAGGDLGSPPSPPTACAAAGVRAGAPSRDGAGDRDRLPRRRLAPRHGARAVVPRRLDPRRASPRGNLTVGSQTAAAAFAMCGDDEAWARWRALAGWIGSPTCRSATTCRSPTPTASSPCTARTGTRRARCSASTRTRSRLWHQVMWRPWYAALWAEAAVLVAPPDAAERIAVARRHSTANEVAQALVRARLRPPGRRRRPGSDRRPARGARRPLPGGAHPRPGRRRGGRPRPCRAARPRNSAAPLRHHG